MNLWNNKITQKTVLKLICDKNTVITMGRPKGPAKIKQVSLLDAETISILDKLVEAGVAPNRSSTIAWALKFAFEARKRKTDIEACEDSIQQMQIDIADILRRLETIEAQQKIMTDATAGAASYLASASTPYDSNAEK